jgi:hypothetical protein
LTFSFAQAQKKDWKTFTSPEGRFSVLMPDKPTPSKVGVFTPRGAKESNTFTYSDENLNDYLFAYSRFRDNDERVMDSDELLNKVQKGILATEEGKLRSSIALMLDDIPGREVTVEHSDGSFKTHRFYIAGNYFYQLSVEIKNKDAQYRAEKTERFLNSFRLSDAE